MLVQVVEMIQVDQDLREETIEDKIKEEDHPTLQNHQDQQEEERKEDHHHAVALKIMESLNDYHY